jgi:hypothetical protein
MTAAIGAPDAALLAPGAELPSTLAGALTRHGNGELARATTRPAVDCAIRVPSERTSAAMATRSGVGLARLVDDVSAPADRLRVGLEAHWLLAAASEWRTFDMRHRFHAVGVPWLRALLGCAALLDEARSPAFALDLMSWAVGVAQQLTPHVVIDRAVAEVVHEVHQQHARLLAATGDVDGARLAHRNARRITALRSDAHGG